MNAFQFIKRGKQPFDDIRYIVSEDKKIFINRDKTYPKLDVFDACKQLGLTFTGKTIQTPVKF